MFLNFLNGSLFLTWLKVGRLCAAVDLFRIDLPLLMLYLDTHKIDRNKVSPSLKEYLNSDGTVNQECKDIIKDFAL